MNLAPDTLYKILAEDGTSRYGHYAWPLPDGKPGKWVRAKGPLKVCANGIHLCRETDLLSWLVGPAMYVAEVRGKRIDCDDKIVVREARLLHRVETWNEKSARLFACDCAERAMRLVETKHGTQGKRSWDAISVARRFALGEVNASELHAAWNVARDAAGAAAWDAAWNVARDAAGAAAWDAEREWQTVRLMEYLRGVR